MNHCASALLHTLRHALLYTLLHCASALLHAVLHAVLHAQLHTLLHCASALLSTSQTQSGADDLQSDPRSFMWPIVASFVSDKNRCLRQVAHPARYDNPRGVSYAASTKQQVQRGQVPGHGPDTHEHKSHMWLNCDS